MRTGANDGIVVRLAIHAADVTNCVSAINGAVLLSVVGALGAAERGFVRVNCFSLTVYIMVSRSAARSYRRHRRSSHCVKLKRRTCRSTAGCKYANGRKRRYCRKARNTRRRRYKLRLRHKRRRTSVRRGGTRRRRGGRKGRCTRRLQEM